MFPNLQAEQARHKMHDQIISNYLGLSRSTYSRKKQNGKFTVFECDRLCRLFDCKFEYLFFYSIRPENQINKKPAG